MWSRPAVGTGKMKERMRLGMDMEGTGIHSSSKKVIQRFQTEEKEGGPSLKHDIKVKARALLKEGLFPERRPVYSRRDVMPWVL